MITISKIAEYPFSFIFSIYCFYNLNNENCENEDTIIKILVETGSCISSRKKILNDIWISDS